MKTYSTLDLTDRALGRFWRHGFEATSVEDLVAATGVSRHGLYAEFGGKRALYLACFDRYRESVVTPAFARVEAAGGKLDDVRAYFEVQIDAAERVGLPGPGCFVANAMTETAPHDQDVRRAVEAHNARLRRGFARALAATAARPVDAARITALAEALFVFATGLWAASRQVAEAAPLRTGVEAFLRLLEEDVS